jgi:hypothetical protein
MSRWNEVQGLQFLEMEAIARELNLSKAELAALTFRPPASLQSSSKPLFHTHRNTSQICRFPPAAFDVDQTVNAARVIS